MKKQNQLGIAQPLVVALAVLVLGLVSFAAYRVGQNNSSEQAQTENSSDTELAEGIKVNEEEKATEVTVPEEEKTAEPVPVAEEVKKTEPVVEEKKKTDKVYLNISLVSAAQNGAVVDVTSQIETAVTGTCNFKLYQEGQPKVYTSNQITVSQNCVGQLDVSSLATYTGWELHVWFDGADGKTFAYQQEQAFPLTDPN